MAETKWTSEQQSAIETRGCNLLVAAAAGSGKTAVLVERIIKMITDKDNPVDIDKLLVVTFTNAAAAEMRERIADAISKELEKNPDSNILQRQLALLNRSNITTMHSFCLDVIKNNFHLIDLDPNFRIGDTTECILLKSDILEELFEDKYDDEDEDFLNLVEAYGGSKNDTKLSEIVLNLFNFSMSGPDPKRWLLEKAEEFNIESLEDLEESKWWKVLKLDIEVELKAAVKLFEKAIGISECSGGLEPYLINLNDDLEIVNDLIYKLNSNIYDTFNAFSTIKFGRLKTLKKDTVENTLDQDFVKKLRDDGKAKVTDLVKDIFNLSKEEIVDGIKDSYKHMKCLSDLVLEFQKRYEKKKREKGILDFFDLEHLCLSILIEDGKPSSVAERFREKFDEVLVDEYQDSNNVQETIINLVSRKNLQNPNVFMVGDVKQSIYRFRQAKPELFLEKYNTYTEEDGPNKKILLYKNFRSRENIISGVNFIFKKIMSQTVGELNYDQREALNLGADYKELCEENILNYEDVNIENLNYAGKIELHILDKDSMNEGAIENEEGENNAPVLDEEEEEDLNSIQLEARIVTKRIKRLMKDKDGKKYMVWDKSISKYREIRFKDIVILLRATKNWAEAFSEELSAFGIPVYADTGTGYFQTIEIRTILSLLKIIDNPMQDIHILASLRSPIFGFTAEELADLRLIDKEKYFYENIKYLCEEENIEASNLELSKKCRYFLSSLNRWREKSLYMPIHEFLWFIYGDTSYMSYVGAMPNGVQRVANLRILFQRAKQFEKTSFKGLFNFINFINKLRNSEGDMGSAKILGENEDVVRIMSIHKSKGLEFPVVFLSGTGKQFNFMDLNKPILIHEELGFGPNCVDTLRRISYNTLARSAIKKKCKLETLSEEMRVLYVAFTRAKEKLIITGAKSKLEDTITKWCNTNSLSEEYILPSEVMKYKSFLDWIGISIASYPQVFKNNDSSTWDTFLWKKSDLVVDELNEVVDNSEKELFIHRETKEIEKEIIHRLEFDYRFKESTYLPSNISVSDIKRAYSSDEDDVFNLYSKEILEDNEEGKVDSESLRKPKFLNLERKLSSAERGTALHFVMQHLNLDEISTIAQIKNQISEMVEDEFLREEEALSIYVPSILNFFKSDLGKRMLKSYKENKLLKRELPFFTEIPVFDLKKDLEGYQYKNEKIRLQGVIDVFFEEDSEIVLLDYKTDYVGAEGSSKIKDRYEIQLRYYSETLEKITGKKVKNKYIYLFSNGEIIEY